MLSFIYLILLLLQASIYVIIDVPRTSKYQLIFHYLLARFAPVTALVKFIPTLDSGKLSSRYSARYLQKPITRSLQLPHIPVTAFSQTDLFLVLIYLEFRSPQEPRWSIAITSTDYCWHVDMFTGRRIVLSLPKRAHVDWNWRISHVKYLNIDWSVKMLLHWLIMGVVGSW